MKESIKALNQFWFGYGNPLTIGIFRALCGAIIFANFLMLVPFVNDFYGSSGLIPADAGARFLNGQIQLTKDGSLSIERINLLYGITNDTIIQLFFAFTLALSLLVTIGLFTRVSTILLAVAIVSLHHRNPIILHGGDTAMRICALYLAIAPSGAAFSLDRLLRLKKNKEREVQLVSLWPQRLIQYNLALIYFSTVWSKWFGTLWKTGAATWYPSRLNEFKRFPVPDFINQFPMVRISTYGTLAVEFALATLIWFRPLRKWVLLCGIFMHSYIEYSMNIPIFAFIMIAMYITFYEGDEIETWWKRLKGKTV
jgi:hypothetical protein